MFPEDSEADFKGRTGILVEGKSMSDSRRLPKVWSSDHRYPTFRDGLLSKPRTRQIKFLEVGCDKMHFY